MSKTKNRSRVLALVIMLALVIGILPMGAMATGSYVNPLTVTGVMTLTFGDTTNPTWPESNMYFDLVSGTTYNAVYSTNGTSVNTDYYPSLLSMYIVPATGKTISSITGTDVTFVTYAADGTPSTSTSCTVNSAGFYAICPQSANSQIVITSSDSSTVTVKFKAPVTQTSSGGATPLTVCGYLPVGQFARPNSFGWGTIFTDNTNDYGNGNTPKFLNGYVSTGVSLGMLGGYVQFEFEDAIGNDADNPYGIDFIVYGNPFNGNPEAGSVMVYGYNASKQSYGWYTLAGSLHYDSGTTMSTNISYIRIETAGKTFGNRSFGAAGVYYSTDYVHPTTANQLTVDGAISAANWYAIPNSAAHVANPVASEDVVSTAPANGYPDMRTVGISYWPERNTSENYHQVWKINGDTHVGGVFWDVSETDSTVEVITYEGVTMVPDSDTTNDYRFGYADVRQNGTSYGTAINPYASLPASASGGDGFDLSWAVDTDGLPVNLTDVKFVRVYSAVLYNAGTFGETSTEVCGIYVASGSNTGNTNTARAIIKHNDTNLSNGGTEVSDTQRMITQSIVAGTDYSISVYAGNSVLLFKNGEQITGATSSSPHTFTINLNVGETATYQFITQTGSRQPYIEVITFTGVSSNA